MTNATASFKMSDDEFIRREQNVNILRYSGRIREALSECSILIAARGEQASAWHTLAQTWLDLGDRKSVV